MFQRLKGTGKTANVKEKRTVLNTVTEAVRKEKRSWCPSDSEKRRRQYSSALLFPPQPWRVSHPTSGVHVPTLVRSASCRGLQGSWSSKRAMIQTAWLRNSSFPTSFTSAASRTDNLLTQRACLHLFQATGSYSEDFLWLSVVLQGIDVPRRVRLN